MAMEPGSCSHPPALSEEQLDAALEDIADAVVMDHLAQCPFCAARLATLQRFERSLQARLYRQGCPDADALGNYALSLLMDDERRYVESHLTTCVRCTTELQTIQVALSSEAAVMRPSQTATAGAVSRVIGQVRRGVGEMERMIATLLAPQPQLVLRGFDDVKRTVAATARERVILEVSCHGDGCSLAGQLLADDAAAWSGALVEIHQAGDLSATAILDDMSEFACENLKHLPARVVITSTAGQQIVVEEVPFV